MNLEFNRPKHSWYAKFVLYLKTGMIACWLLSALKQYCKSYAPWIHHECFSEILVHKHWRRLIYNFLGAFCTNELQPAWIVKICEIIFSVGSIPKCEFCSYFMNPMWTLQIECWAFWDAPPSALFDLTDPAYVWTLKIYLGNKIFTLRFFSFYIWHSIDHEQQKFLLTLLTLTLTV